MFDEHPKAGNNGHGAFTPEDRRTHPRYHFTGAAEALDSQRRTRMNARTSDIGKGGCSVDTFSPFPLKTPVKIQITREKVSLTAEAKVVYFKIGMGMGLAFTCIESRKIDVLEKWIGKLSSSAPLELTAMPTLDEHLTAALRNGARATESGYVLNELIITLMRKGTLTEEEGKTILLRWMLRDFLP